MKKKAFISMSLLILAAACTQELVNPSDDNHLPLRKGTYATAPEFEFGTFDGSQQTETKVAIDTPSLSFAWTPGDEIGVVPMDSSTNQTNFKVKNIQGDARKCSFDGGAWSLKEYESYCAYYPFSAGSGVTTCNSTKVINMTGQCQRGNGNAEHLSRYIYMHAAPVTNTDGTVNFKFKHLSSIVNFIIPAPATASYESLEIKSEANIFTTGFFKLSDGSISASTGSAHDTLSVSLRQVYQNEGNTLSIFVAMFPWNYDMSDENNRIFLTLKDSDDGEYHFSGLFGKMEAGKGYKVYCTPYSSTTTFQNVMKLWISIGQTGVARADLKTITLNLGDNGGYDNSDVQVNASLENEIPLYARKISSSCVVLHTAARKLLLPSSISGLFSGCTSLTSSGLETWNSSNVDASQVTSASELFSGCTSLTSARLDFLRSARSITTVASMFKNCSNLTGVDLSPLAGKVGALTSISDMFNGCTSLQSVDLNGWGSTNLTLCERTFADCSSLTTIDLSSLDTRNVTSMFYMMDGCKKVADIYLGPNFSFPSGSTGTTNMFQNLGDTSANTGFCSTFHCNADQWATVQTLLRFPEDYRWDGAAVLPDGQTFNTAVPEYAKKVSFEVSSVPNDAETEIFDNIYRSADPNGGYARFRINAGKFLLSSGDMSGMFRGKHNIEEIEGLDNIDWTGVTDLSDLFSGCTSLESLPGFRNSNLTGKDLVNMSGMYLNCLVLESPGLPTDISTAKVTDMSYMFAGCCGGSNYFNLIKNLDTSSLVDASHMFEGWRWTFSLNLSNWNVRKVENMECMFKNCLTESIFMTGWNTSRLRYAKEMFCGCQNWNGIVSVSFDVSKVKDMSGMFYGCRSLTQLDLSDFSNDEATDVRNMFKDCARLKSLDISRLGTRHANTEGMFDTCESMQKLYVGPDFSLTSLNDSTTFRNFGTTFHSGTGRKTAIDCSSILWDIEFKRALANKYTDWDERFYCTRKGILPTGKYFNDEARLITDDNLAAIRKAVFLLAGGEERSDEIRIAEEGADVYMSFNSSNGTLTVRTPGDRFYLNKLAGSGESASTGMFTGMTNLTEFVGLGDINTSEAENLSYLFAGCESLGALDLRAWNVSNVENMAHLFGYCKSLKTLDLGAWDVSKVKKMSGMFQNCVSLKSVYTNHWNTSNVTDMGWMFDYCSSITELDLRHFRTSNVTSMASMFNKCGNLTSLDISTFNTSKVLDFTMMFGWCGSLTKLHINNFDFTACRNAGESGGMGYMFYQLTKLEELRLSESFLFTIRDASYIQMFHNMGINSRVTYLNTLILCTPTQEELIKATMRQDSMNTDDYDFYHFN